MRCQDRGKLVSSLHVSTCPSVRWSSWWDLSWHEWEYEKCLRTLGCLVVLHPPVPLREISASCHTGWGLLYHLIAHISQKAPCLLIHNSLGNPTPASPGWQEPLSQSESGIHLRREGTGDQTHLTHLHPFETGLKRAFEDDIMKPEERRNRAALSAPGTRLPFSHFCTCCTVQTRMEKRPVSLGCEKGALFRREGSPCLLYHRWSQLTEMASPGPRML